MPEKSEQEKEKRICVVCQKKKVFQEWKDNGFDKCFSCAMDYRDQMYEKFVTCLSPEQLALFEVYSKAKEDFTSMVILD